MRKLSLTVFLLLTILFSFSQVTALDTLYDHFGSQEAIYHIEQHGDLYFVLAGENYRDSLDYRYYRAYSYTINKKGEQGPVTFLYDSADAFRFSKKDSMGNCAVKLLFIGPATQSYKLLRLNSLGKTKDTIILKCKDSENQLRLYEYLYGKIACIGNNTVYIDAPLQFILFDTLGNQLISKNYLYPNGDTIRRAPTGIVSVPNGYLIYGSSFDSLAANGRVRHIFPFIMRLNQNGDALWRSDFSGNDFAYFNTFSNYEGAGRIENAGLLKNGNVIALGSANNHPLLLILDAQSGNIIRMHKYLADSIRVASFDNFLETDSFLYASGFAPGYNFIPIPDKGLRDHIPFLYKIDKQNGKILGEKYFPYTVNRDSGEYINSGFFSLSMGLNKEILLGGYTFPEGMGRHKSRLVVLDPNTAFINGIAPINTIPQSGITVFPNPFKQLVNITSDVKIHSVSIYDGLGMHRQINSEPGYTFQLDLEELNQGLYFLLIETENARYTKRLVKLE